MPRLFYSILFYLAIPVILIRLLWRASKNPSYACRWVERFGFVPRIPIDQKVIWIHSVSVGEALASVPLIKALQERYPTYRCLVTCMTPTGSERIKTIFLKSVEHCYLAYDTPDAVSRFFERVHPSLCIIMETELWPNMINGCDKRNIPVILANGRLSLSSAKGYKKFSYLVRPMMRQLSWVAAQSGDDAIRFSQLGVNKEALSVTGNIKFDLIIDEALREKSTVLLREWRGPESRPIILAASTHRGEDEIILEAFAEIKSKLASVLLVLVPRHPERFNQVEALCLSKGMKVGRRSSGSIEPSLDVLLGDTMGELISFFGSCDIAFVGGSLVPTGGHNIIEPAAWGVPILSGPHLFNFTEASELLVRSGGMIICESAQGLADSCIQILKDDELRSKMGASSLRIADENRGALNRLLDLVDQAILR